MHVTLGLILVASLRKEWPMTFIAVRCPHCQSDQIVKRGKTARGSQRYLTDGVSHLQTINDVELYKLAVQTFGLAVGIRLFHAGQHNIFPLRGEPRDHMGFDHRFILPRR